jgi:hypothetical protein
LLPADPYSGEYAFWSNKGDESNMTLTREFDFSNVSGPIELSFQTWYDIETDWDYVYVEVSENGENWEILTTPSGTGTDPSGNSYGWGYTGVTDGLKEEDRSFGVCGQKDISSVLNISPMQPSTEKAFCWMTSRWMRQATVPILKRMMAAGRRKDLFAYRTFFPRPLGWL